jgi:hypothetical protein
MSIDASANSAVRTATTPHAQLDRAGTAHLSSILVTGVRRASITRASSRPSRDLRSLFFRWVRISDSPEPFNPRLEGIQTLIASGMSWIPPPFPGWRFSREALRWRENFRPLRKKARLFHRKTQRFTAAIQGRIISFRDGRRCAPSSVRHHFLSPTLRKR